MIPDPLLSVLSHKYQLTNDNLFERSHAHTGSFGRNGLRYFRNFNKYQISFISGTIAVNDVKKLLEMINEQYHHVRVY